MAAGVKATPVEEPQAATGNRAGAPRRPFSLHNTLWALAECCSDYGWEMCTVMAMVEHLFSTSGIQATGERGAH